MERGAGLSPLGTDGRMSQNGTKLHQESCRLAIVKNFFTGGQTLEQSSKRGG